MSIRAILNGTLTEWESPALRASFEEACEEVFGSQCIVKGVVNGVKASSVVINFKIVQYADTGTAATSIVDKFADPAIVARFSAAVASATRFALEVIPMITAVTFVSGDTSALATLSGGTIAGLVIMCFVVTAVIVFQEVHVQGLRRGDLHVRVSAARDASTDAVVVGASRHSK